MFLIENFDFKSQHSLHLIAAGMYNSDLLILSVGNFIFLDYLPTKASFKLLFFIWSFMQIIITILHSISFFESTFSLYCTQFIFLCFLFTQILHKPQVINSRKGERKIVVCLQMLRNLCFKHNLWILTQHHRCYFFTSEKLLHPIFCNSINSVNW